MLILNGKLIINIYIYLFCRGMSDVFATAGSGDIRVWALKSRLELLRIQVPNFICSSVLFSGDGKSIASGKYHPT